MVTTKNNYDVATKPTKDDSWKSVWNARQQTKTDLFFEKNFNSRTLKKKYMAIEKYMLSEFQAQFTIGAFLIKKLIQFEKTGAISKLLIPLGNPNI